MWKLCFIVIVSISLSTAIQSPENISSRRTQNAVNFFPDDTQEHYNTAHGVNDVSSFRFQDDQRDLNQNEILVSPAQKFQQSHYQRPQSPYYLTQYPNLGGTANPQPNPYAGSYGYYVPNQEDNREGARPQIPYPFQRPQQQAGQFGPVNYAAQFANNYRPGGPGVNYPGSLQQVGGSPLYDGYRRPLANVGIQFGQAIENIARYDDLQCVPKILCQMVGNPNRQSNLPSFLSAPSLSALISALPSTSPALIFGRAALLGFSGGESRCDSAYPRCPKNEDDVLNYLNNHRGGFFRFFNGGASFGDDIPSYQQNYRPSYQQQGTYQNPQYQQNQQGTQGNFDLNSLQALLQGGSQSGGGYLGNQGSNTINLGSLASLIGGGGGGQGSGSSTLNSLGSLASLVGGSGQGSSSSTLNSLGSLASLIGGSEGQSQTAGLSQLVGNLLTGIVGARFAGRSRSSGRRIQKRHIDDKLAEGFSDSGELDKLLRSFSEQAGGDTKITSKKRNLNDELGNLSNLKDTHKKKKYLVDDTKKDQVKTLQKLLNIKPKIVKLDSSKEIEAEDRILNISDDSIEAEDRILNLGQSSSIHQISFNPITFPEEYLYVSSEEANRVPKLITFGPPSGIQFPTELHLQATGITLPQTFFPEPFQNQDGIILDIPKPLPLEYYDRTKMIFPDRTGTGNLRFDNEYFRQESIQNNRFGRILTGSKRPQEGTHTGFGGNGASTITYNNGDILVLHRPNHVQQQYPVNFIGQNYASSSQNYQVPQVSTSYPTRSDSGNIYVTNSLGVNEYYINAQGQKIRL